MGASCWTILVPWDADLGRALARARSRAYAQCPANLRERVESASDEELLRAADLDPDDEETWEEWVAWLATAPPETRYVLAMGPNATGTILDIDHVGEELQLRDGPSFSNAAPPEGMVLQLVPPKPRLAPVRWATPDELEAWFETRRPTTAEVGDASLHGSLDRGSAIAIPVWKDGEPDQILFVGVTGD